jgi:hypothetical protein
MALQPFRWALATFQFLDPIHSQQDSLDGRSAHRKDPTYLHIGHHEQYKGTETSMLPVGFELMTPVFEQVKTAHALYRAATLTGLNDINQLKFVKESQC